MLPDLETPEQDLLWCMQDEQKLSWHFPLFPLLLLLLLLMLLLLLFDILIIFSGNFFIQKGDFNANFLIFDLNYTTKRGMCVFKAIFCSSLCLIFYVNKNYPLFIEFTWSTFLLPLKPLFSSKSNNDELCPYVTKIVLNELCCRRPRHCFRFFRLLMERTKLLLFR